MPDASSNTTADPQLFWKQYRWPIIIGLVALLILTLGFAGYQFYRDRQESNAAQALATAKGPEDLQKVIDQFPNTPAAPSAWLLLAEAQQKAKKFDEANTTLQNFINKFPQHQFVPTAKMGIAANLRLLGKTDEALAMYAQIASVNAANYNAPFAMLEQAKILEQQNRIEEARRLCETVIAQYRDAEFPAMEAQGMLATLKPTATPAVPAASAAPSAVPSVAPTATSTPTPSSLPTATPKATARRKR